MRPICDQFFVGWTRLFTVATGKNALMKLVLTGEWRRMLFTFEPGRGPESSWVGYLADRLERIAREDQAFRNLLSERFHRPFSPPTPRSVSRSRRRGPNIPLFTIPFPSFSASGASGAGGDGAGGDGTGDA
jgi:hypothetical protein